MANSGHGVTMTFSSGFFAEILSVSWSGASRAALNTTHSGTTVTGGVSYATFIPADVVDYGQLDVEYSFNPNDTPPINGAAENVTITFPIPAGMSNGATLVSSSFMINSTFTVPAGRNENIMTAASTLKLTGPPTWTDAS